MSYSTSIMGVVVVVAEGVMVGRVVVAVMMMVRVVVGRVAVMGSVVADVVVTVRAIRDSLLILLNFPLITSL